MSQPAAKKTLPMKADRQVGLEIGPDAIEHCDAHREQAEHRGPAEQGDRSPRGSADAELRGYPLGQQRATDDRDEREQQARRAHDGQGDAESVPGQQGPGFGDAIGAFHHLHHGHRAARRGPQGEESAQ